MIWNKLTHTSATVRYIIIYVTLTAASALCVFAYLYWSTARLIEREAIEIVRSEQLSLVQEFSRNGITGVVSDINFRIGASGDPDAIYAVRDGQGKIIAGNLAAWPTGLKTHTSWAIVSGDRTDRTLSLPIGVRTDALNRNYELLVGWNMKDRTSIGQSIVKALASALLLTAVLGIFSGFIFARFILSRLKDIAITADQIIAGDLAQRVPDLGRGDEFDRVAGALNAMLERIENLVSGMRMVTDSVAHDLRSPVNRIRNKVENALRAPDVTTSQAEVLQGIQKESDALINMLTLLLDSARAEAGVSRDQMSALDLATLVEDVCDLYEPSIETAGMALHFTINARPRIIGHRELLAQAMANLLENAIKYGSTGRKVDVTLSLDGSDALLSVADRGPGVPASDRERVVERFVRLDQSRSQSGSGLGLSLVSSVARLHEGRLILRDNKPGLIVILRLPLPGAFSNHRELPDI